MKPVLRHLVLAGAVAATLALAACSSGDPAVVGTWGDPDTEGLPSLTFNADGKYSGTDGCNRVGGSWKPDGDSIDLGAMISTMMFCEGVDTWLSGAATARLADDQLTLLDESGNVLGSLSPAEE